MAGPRRPRLLPEAGNERVPRLQYDELTKRLFPRLSGGIRWGVERTEQLLASVGNPHLSYPTLHVAGTNGKGSVAATLAQVLQRAGLRTGLYTSPHLFSFRERIRVNGEPVSREAIEAAAEPLWPEIEPSGASFFEATTAIGFLALAQAKVDVAVVEVGLGGRLDATNVIRPEIAIITNIARDHADYLGDTLEAIAQEKAGIMKAGVPVITADRQAEVLDVFRRHAVQVGAELHLAQQPVEVAFARGGTDFVMQTERWGRVSLHTPLIGPHQAQNVALAVEALDRAGGQWPIDAETLRRGVAGVRWPGRFQIESIDGQNWVFDVAHNVAGVEALIAAIAGLALPRPLVVMIGILGDKDWAKMLPPLFAAADHAVLTLPPTAPPNRSWHPEEVLATVQAANAQVEPDFRNALATAGSLAGPNGTVLVTGSFHTVGDALLLLGRAGIEPDIPLLDNKFSG